MLPLCNGSVATCPTSVAGALADPTGVVAYVAANPNAQYLQAGYGAQATVGRDTLQLKPINNVNLTLIKRFTFREHYNIEFQGQAFNLFNHPQYVGGYFNNIAPLGFSGPTAICCWSATGNSTSPETCLREVAPHSNWF